jgi:uncharacterized membrane protein SpoIIM required for sporulation
MESYLNHLVSGGYNAFYRSSPGFVKGAVDFLATGFPRLLRANRWYFVTALALFFLPLGIAWALVQNDPHLATRIVPEAQLQMYREMYKKKDKETEQEYRQRSGEARSLMAGFYVQHNTSIAFKCFAGGILLGIFTIYSLLFNGILIGTIAGFVVAEADSERFLSFVVTHGAFELTAIAVAGAAGLILGNAFVHPGQRTRSESLKIRGMDAIKLAIGAGVMLFIAAMIEAFWSPSAVPAVVKYAVGSMLWVVVGLYILIAGTGTKAESTLRS